MKKILKEIIKKTHLVYILSIFFYIFRIFKVDNKKIFCLNFKGKGFGDNPKYIVEQLLKDNKNYKIMWGINKLDDKMEFPSNVKVVKMYSIQYFFHLSTAKIWINNTRFSLFVRKRKNQIYIQTWHGSIPLKKIEYDVEEKLNPYYIREMENDRKLVDYMISNSNFTTNLYKRAFKNSGKILEIGSPRNDILINKNSVNIKDKVYEYYKIKKEKKIILYAPTFRENYSNNPYDIDLSDFKLLMEKEKYDWEIMIRLHPNVVDPETKIKKINDFINATDYNDMQELILACDLVITDYSSIMFDAMIADKPVILYAKDIDDYNNERGFYFDFLELPFELATNNYELKEIMKNKELNDLTAKYKEFKEKIGLKEEGKASKNISELINKITHY